MPPHQLVPSIPCKCKPPGSNRSKKQYPRQYHVNLAKKMNINKIQQELNIHCINLVIDFYKLSGKPMVTVNIANRRTMM